MSLLDNPKFAAGRSAREAWAVPYTPNGIYVSVASFNEACGDVFTHTADIVLDDGPANTTIKTTLPNPNNMELWKTKGDHVYIISRNGIVLKIGGTRSSMDGRWGSYKCGHCVPQRNDRNGNPYPGKMSVTNARLYHTIEKDLLENPESIWKFHVWKIPEVKVTVNILGTPTDIVAQVFHAYESRAIAKYCSMSGGPIPILCSNCDPDYA